MEVPVAGAAVRRYVRGSPGLGVAHAGICYCRVNDFREDGEVGIVDGSRAAGGFQRVHRDDPVECIFPCALQLRGGRKIFRVDGAPVIQHCHAYSDDICHFPG